MSVTPAMELVDLSSSESYDVNVRSPSRDSYATAVHHNNSLSRPESTATLVSNKPRNKPIPSSNYCGLCMFNIPEGTFMLLLPGLSLLLIGAVLSGVWGVKIDGAGFIMLILGALFTAAGVIYWFITWRKHPPHIKKAPNTPVKLTGAFMITDGVNATSQGHKNPAFELQ